jgi:hypothetical protein
MRLQVTTTPKKNTQVEVIREAGSSLDKIRVNMPDDLEPPAAAKILTAVKRHLPGHEAGASVEKILGSELREFYARREASLLRLEELAQKLIEQNEEYRRTVDAQRAAEQQAVEKAKTEYFDKTRADYDAKEGELKKREDELAERAKALDDRASRHVRRQIRKDFLEKLASREKQFQLSKSTNAKRLAVHVLFCLLLAVSLVVAYTGYRAVMTDDKDWYAYLRLVIGLAGFAAATVYYIRWTDQWFRQHADEEFRLQRLALDFDRASWVVEMALEWKQEKGEEIPRELVERLTANLFTAGSGSEALRHPAEDALAALLGISGVLKVNLPGGAGELTLDRKGLQKLKS